MDVGIIGIGSMGKNHARVYSKIRNVNEIYVFDPSFGKIDEINISDINVCNSVDELIDTVDAVSICVPTEKHLDIAKKAIDKNIPCLIEKPIALTADEGKKLLDILNDDLIVGVGHIERFNPIVDEIKKLTNNICYCEIKRHNPGSSRITDSSVIKDLMIHDIDIIFNVLFKDREYDLHCAGNEDVCSSLINFNNSVASLSASRMSSKKIRSIYVEEDDFTIFGDFMLQEVYIYKKPEQYGIKNERYVQENIIEKVLLNKTEPLFAELVTFLDCVKKNTKFPITVDQAINNLEISELMEKGLGWDTINTKQLL